MNHDWQRRAACRGEDLILFFGADGERQPEREQRELEAKAVCSACPVTEPCLDYAVSKKAAGVWGGTTEGDRKNLHRRAQRREAYYRAKAS